jgi:D-alanine-D-alanine ligase
MEMLSGKWIIKSVWEHASIGLDESGLVEASSEADILPLLKEKAPMMGGACFAERFIEGREFNLSLLCGSEGPEVLPPAEIIFQDYGPEKIRIVDYKAKWDPDSFAYHHTPRSFDFAPEDRDLLERLKKLASDCWAAFGLSGYARVDFRVDEKGNPRILEVNTNPCISPDAGFAAALEQAGIPFSEAVRRILENI